MGLEYSYAKFDPINTVIDVYSGWCGPCKAVQGLFRRVKNELGDDLLRFATVFYIMFLSCFFIMQSCFAG